MDYIIRKITDEDLEDILEIENQNFSHPFKKDDFIYELNNPFSYFYGIEVDKKIVSYIIFWKTFDSSTVCKIATENSKKKLGFAGLLLENMEKILKEDNVEFSTLEVRKSNLPAINLYKKFGYQQVNVKPKYYNDGEDALYMVKGLI